MTGLYVQVFQLCICISRLAPNHDFNPVKWSQYFDTEETVETENGTFHIYKKGASGPAVVCLHGGGYSGLTWALFAVNMLSRV